MSGNAFLVLLAIEAACGAAGGIAAGRWMRAGASWTTNMLVGAVGGLVLAWLTGFVPPLARFVGHVETAADATLNATGGLTPTVLVGAGIAGLLGGTILTGIAGLVFRREARRFDGRLE